MSYFVKRKNKQYQIEKGLLLFIQPKSPYFYGKIRHNKKYLTKINMIKDKLKDKNTSDEESMALRTKLQKIPLNALSVRKRNRCALTGRPRGVYRKFTLGRTKLREMAMQGLIPGLTKASW